MGSGSRIGPPADPRVRAFLDAVAKMIAAETLADLKARGRNVHRVEELDVGISKLDDKGLEAMLPDLAPDFARPRRHELAAALNRLRTLQVVQR